MSSVHEDEMQVDVTEKQTTKKTKTTAASTQDQTYAQVTSDHPPAQSIAPDLPSEDSSSSSSTPPFLVLDRDQLWTTTDAVTQVLLNNDASTNLQFPRYLDVNGHDIINALDDLEFEFPLVKAVRRLSPGNFTVTFDSKQTKQRFLLNIGFIVKGFTPLIQEVRVPPVFVHIRNASPELPDAAVIARLRCFGDVLSFRRCLYRGTCVENGFRTARMKIRTPIPSFLRLASESLHIIYDGQPRTCKRCNRVGHEARDCNVFACYNCEEIGHVAARCAQPTACSICKSVAHKATHCPFAVIDDLTPHCPISETLASALQAVPVLPSATPTIASEIQEEEANLTEAADLQPDNNDPRPEDGSPSSANTAILSTADRNVPPAITQPVQLQEALPAVQLQVALPPQASTSKANPPETTPKPARTRKSRNKAPVPVTEPSPTATPPDAPDDVSVASSKRKAKSQSSEEVHDPFSRKPTRPLPPHQPRKKQENRPKKPRKP